MRSSRAKALIIGLLVCALSACTAVRLSYANGPTLATFWLDNWLDLDAAQTVELKPELQRWFDWHRANELPRYATPLAQWRARAAGEVSAAEVCDWSATTRGWMRRAFDQAAPAAARLLPTVSAAQWEHLVARQQQRTAKLRRELPATEDERRRAMLDRWVQRAEDYYGNLAPAQRAQLAADVAASPRGPQAWIDQREARQREIVAGLRAAQQVSDPAQRAQALRTLVAQELEPSTADASGQREARWREHLCATAARLHNSMNTAQRARLQKRLEGWQGDLVALTEGAGGG
ncbi:MAG: DUF6279 family lipoprotein [Rubrivivax sp.]